MGLVSRLDRVDLSLRLSREEEEVRLAAAQRRLLHLRLVLGGLIGDGTLGPPVCVLFEGWDASGKGGAIKRLVGRLDPRHVRVAQFAAPTPDEKRHHFLARFYVQLPGWGGMAVFDRSWYGRVLVERVDGFATVEQWERGYEEIVHFERSLALEGTVLVKLWLHISAEEQLRRFESRRDDPLKEWKLTADDYGRDHHPRCFSIWMAGGGIKPGVTWGETDDYSYNITRDPVHVHDLHATILHLLGIDHTKLTYRYSGRDFRLTDVSGTVLNDIIA